MLKIGETIFLERKLRISEIHLQQQIHDTSKEILKNNYLFLYNHFLTLLLSQSKEEGKDQESIQSSTAPYQGHRKGKGQHHTKESQ